MKWVFWPLGLLAMLGFFVMAGAGWAEPSGADTPVVSLDVTPSPTATPVRSYLPYMPKDSTPTPTATPTPPPGWLGQYFNNPDLSGSPALTRVDSQIDFDWGDGSPDPVIPINGFSVRWTRTMNFDAGDYNFFAFVDDGVRLWVDDQMLLDEWRDQSAKIFTSFKPLTAGSHTVKMEYYDRVDRAAARLAIVNTTAYPQPQNWEWGTWKGEYFDNADLSGDPRLVRKDNSINFDWGAGSPDPSIPADNFSVRWTASLFLKGGTYDFFPYTDDGVRLFVDGQLIINEWHDQGASQHISTISLNEGVHLIRMEYFERTGGAAAQLWWHNTTQFSNWRGEYYTNNRELERSGGYPVVIRGDRSIDFDWGSGSPDPSVSADNFSVRWTGILDLDGGDFTFRAFTDDGVRLWIDGIQGLNEWHDQGAKEWVSILPLGGGVHFVRMEFYEGILTANARLTWENTTGQ